MLCSAALQQRKLLLHFFKSQLQVRDLEQKPAEGKSKGHLILTKQSKHLVTKAGEYSRQ